MKNPIVVEPIVCQYHIALGRPTVPVRVYIRMMVIKAYLCVSFEAFNEVMGKTQMYKWIC